MQVLQVMLFPDRCAKSDKYLLPIPRFNFQLLHDRDKSTAQRVSNERSGAAEFKETGVFVACRLGARAIEISAKTYRQSSLTQTTPI